MANNKQWYDLVAQTARKKGFAESDIPIIQSIVKQESGWNPNARSKVGALGLMQLMPATAKGLGVTNPLDPVQNINGGITYLKQQYDRFGGNMDLALAAYNAGPGAVAKHKGIPPYRETQNYVRNIKKMAGNQTGHFANSQGFTGTTPVTAPATNLVELATVARNTNTPLYQSPLATKPLYKPVQGVTGFSSGLGDVAKQNYLKKEVSYPAPMVGPLPPSKGFSKLGERVFSSGVAQPDISAIEPFIGNNLAENLNVNPELSLASNRNAVEAAQHNIRGGALKGAATGAGVGLLFGPVGAVAGGLLGAAIGGVKGRNRTNQITANQLALIAREGQNAFDLGNKAQIGSTVFEKQLTAYANIGGQNALEYAKTYKDAISTGDPNKIAETTQMLSQVINPTLHNAGMALIDTYYSATRNNDPILANNALNNLARIRVPIDPAYSLKNTLSELEGQRNSKSGALATLVSAFNPTTQSGIEGDTTLGAARINQATSFGVTDRTNAGNLQVTNANIKANAPIVTATAENIRTTTKGVNIQNQAQELAVKKIAEEFKTKNSDFYKALSAKSFDSIPSIIANMPESDRLKVDTLIDSYLNSIIPAGQFWTTDQRKAIKTQIRNGTYKESATVWDFIAGKVAHYGAIPGRLEPDKSTTQQFLPPSPMPSMYNPGN